MYSKNQYDAWRLPFLPSAMGIEAKLVFVAESPPPSGKYFYKSGADEKATEPLFRNIMLALFKRGFAQKVDGLRLFQKSGFILTDSCYSELTNNIRGTQRSRIILSGLGDLLRDLESFSVTRRPTIVLIKSNVCDLLEPVLSEIGYEVANRGVRIPFPARDPNGFQRGIEAVLGGRQSPLLEKN